MTFVKYRAILKPSSRKSWKGGAAIANEIIFTELKSRNVSLAELSNALGISAEVLPQILRFELEEQEQIRLLWLINNLSEREQE